MGKPELVIIAAMAENRVIGRNNALPWSVKEDLARFKRLTMGFPCIMGRRTYESLPVKPLPGRPNLVVSASLVPGALGAVRICPTLEGALAAAAGHERAFICGGASLYREALALADVIELTKVRGRPEGDAYFPELDPAVWEECALEDHGGFCFVTLRHKEKL